MNRQFGALSGMAMVLIVLNHAIHMGFEALARGGYPIVTGWGRVTLSVLQNFGSVFAVPVFLFISGSFVAYAARGEPPKLSRKFIISTLQHILIPYVIWSLTFYIIVLLTRNQQYSPLGYLKNLATGYPFHFIPLLVTNYVLAPLWLRLGKRYGWLLLGAVGLYQIVLLTVREPGIFGFSLPPAAGILAPPVLFNPIADWGIFFPLGVVFSLHSRALKPRLQQFRWPFALATVALFTVGLLNGFDVLFAPWARYLAPVAFMLLVPVISRNAIPLVREFEKIGKRAYGLYLTHLIMLELVLVIIQVLVPALFRVQFLLFPLLFVLGLEIPLLVMNSLQRAPTRKVYRYVFG